MAQTLRERLDNRFTALQTERASWVDQWGQIADYMLPRRSRFLATKVNKGDRRDSKIINSTAGYALRTLGAGMAAGVTSPTSPWFALGTRDPALKEFGPVKDWLGIVEDVMYAIFAAGNFYQAMPSVYEELGAFGTAALFQEEDYDDVCRWYPFTAGEYYLANDSRGKASTFYREFQMTVENMVREYGKDRCTQTVQNQYDDGNLDTWITVRHAVEPYSDRYGDEPAAKRWAYVSTYWEPQAPRGSKPLRLKGYQRCPVHCPRWHLTLPDVYGRSPAMEVLGDVKQLQVEERRKAQGIDKLVSPPLQGPALMNQHVDLLPGAYNARAGGQTERIEPVYSTPPNLQYLLQDIATIEARINRAFYVDLFLMLAQSQMTQPVTAREIDERHEEKLLMLGPVLTNVNHELLSPAVNGTFEIVMEASRPFWAEGGGMVPPPPRELSGQDLKIEYISALQQAQRAVRTVALDRFVQSSAILGQLNPAALDKLDVDQAMDEMGNMLGVPAGVIRSDDEVKVIRDERKQAQAAAQQQQAMLAATQGAKNLGGASMDNTALGALAGTGAPQGAVP